MTSLELHQFFLHYEYIYQIYLIYNQKYVSKLQRFVNSANKKKLVVPKNTIISLTS